MDHILRNRFNFPDMLRNIFVKESANGKLSPKFQTVQHFVNLNFRKIKIAFELSCIHRAKNFPLPWKFSTKFLYHYTILIENSQLNFGMVICCYELERFQVSFH